MNIKVSLLVGFLLAGAAMFRANAQQSNNQHYQEQAAQQRQAHAAEMNRLGYMNQPSQIPTPTSGEWKKTWGAIAADGEAGSLGAAVGVSSKQDAENAAIADCQAKGGKSCRVSLAYHNQCAAMVVGSKNYSSYGASSLEEARQYGMESCNKTDTNCRIYYSACSEPEFIRY